MKRIAVILLLLFASGQLFAQSLEVPLGGNAFSSLQGSKTVTTRGIENWTDLQETFTVYVWVSKPGSLVIYINLMPSGNQQKATLNFSVMGQPKTFILDPGRHSEGFVGDWYLKDTGYVAIKIKGIAKSTPAFPLISALKLSGTAVNEKTYFVKNNDGNFFYWGRRGPSVHLNYQMPAGFNATWFYNEITVPEGNDVVGSYFMANGFGEGYFGMQVNSENERRVLFSVWSPFATDDPGSIPESHKIKMLKKGTGVYTGEFGNEGSGGQSYLKYRWRAGNTYRFLLKGTPAADSTTTYTAWFYAPEVAAWQLIASFKRPKTRTSLHRLHSFLENFIPETGNIKRRVLFNNQWVADASGNWINLSTARFTTDNTGNKRYRLDFAGGTSEGAFYLENCGFFNHYTLPGTLFTKTRNTIPPAIDFDQLP